VQSEVRVLQADARGEWIVPMSKMQNAQSSKIIMMIVTCDKCGHDNPIKNYEAFRGMKNVVFTCKNKSCKNKVKFFLPVEEPQKEKNEDVTIALESKTKIASVYLNYLNRNGETISVEISAGVNHLGRKADGFHQEIPIDVVDRHMSRLHAVVIGKESGGSKMSILRDYSSKNKVKLNGKVLSNDEEIYLMDGDEIVLGTTIIRYQVNYNQSES